MQIANDRRAVLGGNIMNAREMAEIMLTWPDGSASDDRKFFRKLARTFPNEDLGEIHKAVKLVASVKEEQTRQMEHQLGLAPPPRMNG
jgi:hypothetical protein